MDIVIPLPFVLLKDLEDARVEIRETANSLVIEHSGDCQSYPKTHIRSILIECTLCVRKEMVRGIEVLFCTFVAVKLEQAVPLVQIEDSFGVTVAQASAFTSYYLVGANQQVLIAHLQDNRIDRHIIYDLILTDSVIDMGEEFGVRRSMLADLRCVV
jgi:hypothetical protein